MRYVLYTLITLTLIIVDQWTKWFVSESVLRQSSQSFIDWMVNAPERLDFTIMEITSFLNLVMVWNWGISFGLFNSQSGIGPIILSAIAIAFVLFFIVWLVRSNHLLQQSAILLVVAGALGNVIDRLRFNAVIDFVDLHVFGYHWPAFNFADACISIGVIMLLIYLFIFEKEVEKNNRHKELDALE